MARTSVSFRLRIASTGGASGPSRRIMRWVVRVCEGDITENRQRILGLMINRNNNTRKNVGDTQYCSRAASPLARITNWSAPVFRYALEPFDAPDLAMPAPMHIARMQAAATLRMPDIKKCNGEASGCEPLGFCHEASLNSTSNRTSDRAAAISGILTWYEPSGATNAIQVHNRSHLGLHYREGLPHTAPMQSSTIYSTVTDMKCCHRKSCACGHLERSR